MLTNDTKFYLALVGQALTGKFQKWSIIAGNPVIYNEIQVSLK